MDQKQIAARIRKLTETAISYSLSEQPRKSPHAPTTMEISLSHFSNLANEIDREADTAPDLLAALKEIRDFVAIKFDWAAEGGKCEFEDRMCAECQEAGCISDKIDRACAAIAKAEGRAS